MCATNFVVVKKASIQAEGIYVKAIDMTDLPSLLRKKKQKKVRQRELPEQNSGAMGRYIYRRKIKQFSWLFMVDGFGA